MVEVAGDLKVEEKGCATLVAVSPLPAPPSAGLLRQYEKCSLGKPIFRDVTRYMSAPVRTPWSAATRRTLKRSGGSLRFLRTSSGPLSDRIDIHIEVPRVDCEKLSDDRLGEPSAALRERVEAARDRQRQCFEGDSDILANADMGPAEVREQCVLDDAGRNLRRYLDLINGLADDKIANAVRETLQDSASFARIKVLRHPPDVARLAGVLPT